MKHIGDKDKTLRMEEIKNELPLESLKHDIDD
jgi:hypothetical protein